MRAFPLFSRWSALTVLFCALAIATVDAATILQPARSFRAIGGRSAVTVPTYKIIREFPSTLLLGGVVTLNGKLFFPLSQSSGAPGSIVEISPVTGKYTTIHQFGGEYGQADWLTPDNATNTLFGVSFYGGHGNGFVFAQTIGGGYRHLYDFPYNGSLGQPQGPVLDVGGTLYGTCNAGVYAISPSGAFSLLPIAGNPHGNLVVLNGTIYGMTLYGSTAGLDSIFTISSSGAVTTIYSALAYLYNAPNNVWNLQGLYVYNGVVYGSAQFVEWPADYTPSSLFALSPGGTVTVLAYISDPAYWTGTQVRGSVTSLNGNFYGQTGRSLYEVTSTGSASVIREFPHDSTSGPGGGDFYVESGGAGLAVLNGSLYGTYNYDYGTSGGWIYSITP